jgi:hypothetical protein
MLMKIKCAALAIILFSSTLHYANAQNVGVGTEGPLAPLHVVTNQAEVTRFENVIPLASNINTGIYFKTGSWFTGAIKTMGTSGQEARLGIFTFASSQNANLVERVSITDDGKVGINQLNPVAQLDVNGRVKITDGTQGVNRILSSDATGLASWSLLPGSINFGATQSAGMAISSGVDTPIPFTSENYDNGNQLSGGIFTAAATGIYHFDVDVPTSGVLQPFMGAVQIDLVVNNSVVRRDYGTFSSNTAFPGLSLSCDLNLTAGSTVRVNFRQFNANGNPINIGGSAPYNNPHFTGHRVF